MKQKAAFLTLLTAFSAGLSGSALASRCEVPGKIVFAGLDWDSNAFHTALAQRIMRDGYGCQVDQIPGSTIPLHTGMAKGDIDVMMEVWASNTPAVYQQAVDKGVVTYVGINLPDATQGWFVPRYVVEGANAKAAGLKSVADLPRYKHVFADPEQPGKGRFLNCIAGWQCEVTNTKKLYAYGLNDSYNNVRPGTGAALDAVVAASLKRKKPVLFYYWGPTWLLGKYGQALVMLQEPKFDQGKWDALQKLDKPELAREATAYPTVEVHIAANTEFLKKAPALHAFLKNYRTTGQVVSDALAYMQANKASADDAAQHFLKMRPEVWQGWVPADVAARVKQAL